MEGLRVEDRGLSVWVLPLSVAILTVLLLGQRLGTAVVGHAFGPIMVVWFVVIGAMGVPAIVSDVLVALNPQEAVAFWLDHPVVAFVAMGAVVLAITSGPSLPAVAWVCLTASAPILQWRIRPAGG